MTTTKPIKSRTPTDITNLITHYDLLLMYQEYVGECIQNHAPICPARPMSFDEWHQRNYLPNLDELTQVITFQITGEGASVVDGYLSGRSAPRNCKCRISAGVVTECGGVIDADALKKFAKKLSQVSNERFPTVTYQGKTAYFWTWD